MGERETASLSGKLGTWNREMSRPRASGPCRSQPAPRSGESIEMAQRTLKRVLAGGALMAALTLTTPSPAQAAGLGMENLWGWLSGLWAGPAPTMASGHAPARKPSPRTGPLEKLGPCI